MEAAYREAIDCTRMQEARFYELEATTALARWLSGTGRGAEAHAVLTKIYALFTEGFDAPALKDAKTLLDEMSATPKRRARRPV